MIKPGSWPFRVQLSALPLCQSRPAATERSHGVRNPGPESDSGADSGSGIPWPVRVARTAALPALLANSARGARAVRASSPVSETGQPVSGSIDLQPLC